MTSRKFVKSEYFWEIVFLVIFFLIETFTKNEVLLTFFAICFGLYFFVLPKDRKIKIWLWVIGCLLGFTIEVLMGFWGRSQFWTYGSLFGVPLWLPFAWGLGFEAIYMLGKFIGDAQKN